MQRKNRCDLYNELWVKMYVECVVIYDKDMDIANKESKKEIFTSGSLRFRRRVILVSYGILLCIYKYELCI